MKGLRDGTGAIVVHKKLDAGIFELPKPTRIGDQHVIVSDAIFEVITRVYPWRRSCRGDACTDRPICGMQGS